MVMDPMARGTVFSVNYGESLKDFRKENNLIRWLFDHKDNSWQHFRSKLEATRRPAVRLLRDDGSLICKAQGGEES